MPNFGGVSPLFKNPTIPDDETDPFDSTFTDENMVQDEPPVSEKTQTFKPKNSTLELLRKAYTDKYEGNETGRLEQATDRADNREFIAQLNDAASRVGNLRGKPTENSFVSDAARSSQSDIANAKMLDQSEISGLENQYKLEDLEFNRGEKQRKSNLDADENDANSDVSKSYRELASKYFGGKEIPPSASAAFIKKTLPDLQRIYLKQLELGTRKELKDDDQTFKKDENQKDRELRAKLAAQALAKKEADSVVKAQASVSKTEDSNKQKMGNREYDMFKQYIGEKSVQDYEKINTTFNQMLKLLVDPSSDQALITLFNRTLDPASVVRESEFAITEKSGGALDTLEAAINKAKGTGRITDDIRKNILGASKVLTEGARAHKNRKKKQYFDFATKAGLDPSRIFPTDEDEDEDKLKAKVNETEEYEEWKPGGSK